MSDNVEPQVLPGDLITRPGLYESRCQGFVEVREWEEGYGWLAHWPDKSRHYYSSGEQVGSDDPRDPYQLLHWYGPLTPQKPQPETTSEQIAEIEEQVTEHTPATEYTPPEGWRVLVAGEVLQDGDMWVWPTEHERRPTIHAGMVVGANMRYIRPIEPQSKPQPEKFIIPDDVAAQQLVRGLVLQVAAAIEQQETTEQQQPEKIITPDDVAGEALAGVCDPAKAEQQIAELQAQVEFLNRRLQEEKAVILKRQQRNEQLVTQGNQQRMQIAELQAQVNQARDHYENRIGYLETINQGQTAAVKAAGEQNTKLRELATNAGKQLEQAAEEISELRRSLDDAEKQLDQKDAQIRDLRIELEAAQEAPQPVGDEEREQIWNQATEQAGQLVIRWLRPLTQAMISQPDDRLCRFMAMTLSILPDILPHVLGYAEEGESLDSDGKPE